MDLYSVVYVSSATSLFTDEDLQVLLAEARQYNRSLQITGMLLYCEGNFMQLLEGTKAAINVVLSRVRASRRHKGLLTIYDEPIAQREFGDWDMAYRRLERAEFEKLNFGTAPSRVMLQSFVQTAR